MFLDAIDAGRRPGTLVVLEREELPRILGLKLSPHQIDLREVLALAELRGAAPSGDGRVWAWSLPGSRCATG